MKDSTFEKYFFIVFWNLAVAWAGLDFEAVLFL